MPTVVAYGAQYDFISKYEGLLCAQNERSLRSIVLPSVVSAFIAFSPYGLFGVSLYVLESFFYSNHGAE